jgi:hypothetical protein
MPNGGHAMSIPYEQLKDSALNLDLNARANLARLLLESLDELSEAENEALWLDEAERRQQEVAAGTAKLRDGGEVFQRVAESLK